MMFQNLSGRSKVAYTIRFEMQTQMLSIVNATKEQKPTIQNATTPYIICCKKQPAGTKHYRRKPSQHRRPAIAWLVLPGEDSWNAKILLHREL
jgi:hypothetical protein